MKDDYDELTLEMKMTMPMQHSIIQAEETAEDTKKGKRPKKKQKQPTKKKRIVRTPSPNADVHQLT